MHGPELLTLSADSGNALISVSLTKSLQLSPQRGSRYAEFSGYKCTVTVKPGEEFHDVPVLLLLFRRSRFKRLFPNIRSDEDIIKAYRPRQVRTQSRISTHDVLKLAHIAGPVVGTQFLQQTAQMPPVRNIRFRSESEKYPFCHVTRTVRILSQRQHVYLENIEPVIEINPEPTPGHFLFKIPVCRRNDADIHGNLMG